MCFLYVFLYRLFNPEEYIMRNQPAVRLKWKKIEVSASGISALLAVVIVSLCIVAALAMSHAIGCVFT